RVHQQAGARAREPHRRRIDLGDAVDVRDLDGYKRERAAVRVLGDDVEGGNAAAVRFNDHGLKPVFGRDIGVQRHEAGVVQRLGVEAQLDQVADHLEGEVVLVDADVHAGQIL